MENKNSVEEAPALLQRVNPGGWVTQAMEKQLQTYGVAPACAIAEMAADFKAKGCQFEVAHVSPSGVVVDIFVTTPEGKNLGIAISSLFDLLDDGITLVGQSKLRRRLIKKALLREGGEIYVR